MPAPILYIKNLKVNWDCPDYPFILINENQDCPCLPIHFQTDYKDWLIEPLFSLKKNGPVFSLILFSRQN
jgi:hypothetical protein